MLHLHLEEAVGVVDDKEEARTILEEHSPIVAAAILLLHRLRLVFGTY